MTLARFFVAILFSIAAVSAHALETAPYSAEALTRAQAGVRPVAVLFHADWCPTCRAQDKAIQALKKESGLDMTVLVANYDTEKELKRRFRVNSQSTLVVLRGEKETARLVGDTDINRLRAAFQSAL